MSLSLLRLHFLEFYSPLIIKIQKDGCLCSNFGNLAGWDTGSKMCWHFRQDPSNSLPFTSPPCDRARKYIQNVHKNWKRGPVKAASGSYCTVFTSPTDGAGLQWEVQMERNFLISVKFVYILRNGGFKWAKLAYVIMYGEKMNFKVCVFNGG